MTTKKSYAEGHGMYLIITYMKERDSVKPNEKKMAESSTMDE